MDKQTELAIEIMAFMNDDEETTVKTIDSVLANFGYEICQIQDADECEECGATLYDDYCENCGRLER